MEANDGDPFLINAKGIVLVKSLHAERTSDGFLSAQLSMTSLNSNRCMFRPHEASY